MPGRRRDLYAEAQAFRATFDGHVILATTDGRMLFDTFKLERRVAERTAVLSAANAELDAFAYAVSHDLRSPLRALNGFSQALLEEAPESLGEDARMYLTQIGDASLRMGALIDGILALSRSTRGVPGEGASFCLVQPGG